MLETAVLYLPSFALWLIVNTILVDLLARGLAGFSTLTIEARLTTAGILLSLGYYGLSTNGVTWEFLLLHVASIATGAIWILSRYRKAKRRVLEGRRDKM